MTYRYPLSYVIAIALCNSDRNYIRMMRVSRATNEWGFRMAGQVVESRQVGNVTYQLELVRCGKASCRKCPHGPYWYAYFWNENTRRTKSVYVGKVPPWERQQDSERKADRCQSEHTNEPPACNKTPGKRS